MHYKKPLGETPPQVPDQSLLNVPFGPMTRTSRRVEQKGTQVWFFFFWWTLSLWSGRNCHGRRTTEIKFHKVAKKTTQPKIIKDIISLFNDSFGREVIKLVFKVEM